MAKRLDAAADVAENALDRAAEEHDGGDTKDGDEAEDRPVFGQSSAPLSFTTERIA